MNPENRITKTPRKPRVPRQRTVNVLVDGKWFLLQIAERLSKRKTEVTYYIGRQVPAGSGVAFHLEKQSPDSEAPTAVYDVNLFGLDGYHLCDCRGFGAHGHCKHVEALPALVQAGRLPGKLPGKPDNVPEDEEHFWREMGYQEGLEDAGERWTVSSQPTDTPNERDLYEEQDAAADQQWELNHGRRPNVRGLMLPDDGADTAA